MEANINWVTPDLATGGDLGIDPDTAMARIDHIIEAGITRIIDMRVEADDGYVWEHFPQVTYTRVPVDDIEGSHLPKAVFDVVVAADRNRTAKTGKMLVHCHMGINRGPSGAYAVLLDRGMDPVDAFDLIRSSRPEAAIYYAMDALTADQQRRGTYDTPEATAERERLEAHIATIWTPAEQKRIAHIIKEKHDFDLRELFA